MLSVATITPETHDTVIAQ